MQVREPLYTFSRGWAKLRPRGFPKQIEKMKEPGRMPDENGVWLDSDEVHELRDQIQALKVGHSLIKGANRLADDEIREIYQEMGEAISKLASSSLFHEKEG